MPGTKCEVIRRIGANLFCGFFLIYEKIRKLDMEIDMAKRSIWGSEVMDMMDLYIVNWRYNKDIKMLSV